jgi:hypothetical protein
MHGDDPARADQKFQVHRAALGQRAVGFPAAVCERDHVDLEVLAIVVEEERLLRGQELPQRARVERE